MKLMNNNICRCLLLELMIFTGFMGCGYKTGELPYETFLDVDVYTADGMDQGVQTGWYAEMLGDLFGIQLNYVDTPDEADLIICSAADGSFEEMAESGMLYNLESFLESGVVPVIDDREILNYRDAIVSFHKDAGLEGIYGIPGEMSRLSVGTPAEESEPEYGPYLRWDIYEEIGYPVIADTESLLEVLKTMQQEARGVNGGEEIYAVSLYQGEEGCLHHGIEFAGIYGYADADLYLVKGDGNSYQDMAYRNSLYMQAIRFYNQAYRQGLMDPESAEQTLKDVYCKMEQGNVLFTFDSDMIYTYNSKDHMENGIGYKMGSIRNMKILSYGVGTVRPVKVIAVGSNAEDPERLLQYINWLYTPEGIMASGTSSMNTAGIVDLTWEVREGVPVLTEFGKQVMSDGDTAMPEEWGGGTFTEGSCKLDFSPVVSVEVSPSGYTYNYRLWASVLEEEADLLDQKWTAQMNAHTSMEYLQTAGEILVSDGSILEWSAAGEAPDSEEGRRIIGAFSWKMIYAQDEVEFEQLYEEMLEALKKE